MTFAVTNLAVTQVLAAAGRDPAGADLTITGTDPALPSPFALGTCAAAAVGATALAAAHLWHATGGPPPAASVDLHHAAAAFRSERHLHVDGAAPTITDPLTADYPTADGVVRLHCNYPRHRDAVLDALHLTTATRAAVTAAAATRASLDLESAVIAHGGAAAALRSPAEWRAHPQGAAVAAEPLIAWRQLTHSPVSSACDASTVSDASTVDSPLGGVNVLDLTRVIAGPVAGRTLAAYGATVLRVGADHLPLVGPLVIDTGFGKRFCHLDLREAADHERLRALIADADVLIQAYRPGALRQRRFGPDDCAALNPRLVYISINAWGHTGPWRDRRGFDSLVQLATGLAHTDRGPRPLPAQVLDHATGWLAAFAAIEGLRRRIDTGGAWHARLSLARTAAWLDGLGRVTGGLAHPEPDPAPYLAQLPSPFGILTYVRPPGAIRGYTPQWTTPPHRPGADRPIW
jgi:crotonobetainyl-CoA:carnitine CoA-transferase CaiB-like acyl-CoA transferase